MIIGGKDLFEKRYHPVLVDAKEYLLEVLRYIHLNPVRLYMVTSPDDYPWSSLHAYLGERNEAWGHDGLRAFAIHPNRQLAMAAYRRLVQEGTGQQVSPFAECNPSDRRILGSNDFTAKALGDSWRSRSRKTLEEIIEEAAQRSASPLTSWLHHAGALRASRRAPWSRTPRIASPAAVARRLGREESSLRHGIRKYFGGP